MTGGNSGEIPEETHRRAHTLLLKLHLPLDFRNELLEHGTLAGFAKRELVYLQGSTADMAYWILSGLVKIYCPLPDGTRFLARIAGPGDLVGFIDGLAPDGRRVQAFEAQAMTKVSLAIFTREHVLSMLETLPSAGLAAFLQEVNTAWSELFLWYARFFSLSYHERLQWVFEYLAGRFGTSDSRGIILTPELSHSDLDDRLLPSDDQPAHRRIHRGSRTGPPAEALHSPQTHRSQTTSHIALNVERHLCWEPQP